MKPRILIAVLCIAGALAAQTDDAARARALLKRGIEREDAGHIDEAARDYRAARGEAERIGNRKLVAEADAQLGYLSYMRGDMNDALVTLQRAYNITIAIGDDDARRGVLSTIAHVYADERVGQYDRAIEYYRQVLRGYEAAGAATNVADTLFNLGSTFERKGDFAAALEWYRRSLAAEQKLGRPGEAAYIQRSIGMTLGKLDRPSEALPPLNEALWFFTKTNDVDRAAMVRQSRGIVYRRLGRLTAAIADLEASSAYFAAQKNARFLEKSQDELALAYADAGRWDDAYRTRTTHASLQRELQEKMREEHTSRLRVQFDAEKKEQENRALLRENAAAERIQKLQTIILILGAAIIAVLSYLAVRLVRDSRRMRVMAMTDELTRLPNRRHLLAVAEEQFQRTRAGDAAFSLIALDIDHFKRINDTWGHAAGDVVLQRVAHACRAALRPGDRIGRTGGEEFTVLLPATRLADALAVAERLRAAVEMIRCTDIDPALAVTISLGVAECTPADDALTKIAIRADAELYRAKDLGRNRVEGTAA